MYNERKIGTTVSYILKLIMTNLVKYIKYQLLSFHEVIELGMRSAKKKPLTKKERAEKRKKRKEKRAAK